MKDTTMGFLALGAGAIWYLSNRGGAAAEGGGSSAPFPFEVPVPFPIEIPTPFPVDVPWPEAGGGLPPVDLSDTGITTGALGGLGDLLAKMQDQMAALMQGSGIGTDGPGGEAETATSEGGGESPQDEGSEFQVSERDFMAGFDPQKWGADLFGFLGGATSENPLGDLLGETGWGRGGSKLGEAWNNLATAWHDTGRTFAGAAGLLESGTGVVRGAGSVFAGAMEDFGDRPAWQQFIPGVNVVAGALSMAEGVKNVGEESKQVKRAKTAAAVVTLMAAQQSLPLLIKAAKPAVRRTINVAGKGLVGLQQAAIAGGYVPPAGPPPPPTPVSESRWTAPALAASFYGAAQAAKPAAPLPTTANPDVVGFAGVETYGAGSLY